MAFKIISQTILIILIASYAFCAPTACPNHFFNKTAPDILNDKLKKGTQEICYSEFAVLHSSISKTPLYVSEFLFPQKIYSAKEQQRVDSFFEDPNLLPSDRAMLKDYKRSGYDRGHMAPSADMSSPTAQHESFSLANMVPQNPNNNRGLWAGIEMSVRKIALKQPVYVVSGPLFLSGSIKRIGGRVFVPTHLFKAVIINNKAAVYLVNNDESDDYKVLSLKEFQSISNINLIPNVNNIDTLDLPKPSKR